jgi:four helix bundle protein
MTEDRRQGTGEKLDIIEDCVLLFNMIIKLVDKYPKHKYDVNPHIIRTTVSIGSNISEGNEKSKKEFIRYLNIAIGSCNELRFQIKLLGGNEEIYKMIDKIKATCINIKKYCSSVACPVSSVVQHD